MPHKCSVPGCNGNYANGPKVAVFKFPLNDEGLARWLNGIKRDNFVPTKNSRVCERHFEPHLILRESSAYDEKTGKTITCRLDKPDLVPGATPTLLPDSGCPSYLSSSSSSAPRSCPTSKAQLREEQQVLQALEASEESFREDDSLWSCDFLNDIKDKLHLLQLNLPWTTLMDVSTVHLCFTSPDYNLSKYSMSYPSDFLVFASIFYNVSPHAYRFLRDSAKIILPSYSTVRRLILSNCMDPRTEQTNGTFLYYISKKFKSLKPRDYIVNLLIDEIHLHSFFISRVVMLLDLLIMMFILPQPLLLLS
ncbi:hypothetical protein CAPTEDRAFT_205911 [Capitella teleta]|uniref:THAP-type domain-containing protein n=1 Tax=Capitella teleta TaxID=283909 RepID=R7UWF1_CAPTE|nr:hypothetical protein CAPTEDRAFT_205911 [Capitella teleta]|eukprot:ELU07706.1 hypothetical protein CAPTEDRAFT_205911 [Capitella teleta]